jgi:predicted O-methyltransferase YrrM
MNVNQPTSPVPEDILEKLLIPPADSSTPIKNSEAIFIYNFIKSEGLVKTLETGFAYGKSASVILAATGSRHIAIDPFQDNYDRLGVKNIESLGFQDLLELYEDFSHNTLPLLLRNGELFDFIFIDGDHKFDGVLLDFYYADLLLNENGYVLLHDTWMRSTRILMKFIKTNRIDFIKIPTRCRNLALYQKVDHDKRDGLYFKEFYTHRSLISHNLIRWITSGKESLLKSLLLKLKDKVK